MNRGRSGSARPGEATPQGSLLRPPGHRVRPSPNVYTAGVNGLPVLPHPVAAVLGLLLGIPLGAWLGLAAERFAYDDEEFDPGRGPRPERIYPAQLADLSHLPWWERVPFLGFLVGMVRFCRFEALAEPSRCDDCQVQLAPGDRWPVLSWLRLEGRCRSCRAPLPVDHLLLEVATPLAMLVVFGLHGWSLAGVLFAVMTCACLVASLVDLKYQIIPDEVSTAALAIGLGSATAQTLRSLATGLPATAPPGPEAWYPYMLPDGLVRVLQALHYPPLAEPWHLGWAVGGLLVGGLSLWVLLQLGTLAAGTEAMGAGDVKLAAALGVFLGPKGIAIALFQAAFLGAGFGLALLLLGGGKREGGFTKFAFGPYICLGALLVMVGGADLAWQVFQAWADLWLDLAPGRY